MVVVAAAAGVGGGSWGGRRAGTWEWGGMCMVWCVVRQLRHHSGIFPHAVISSMPRPHASLWPTASLKLPAAARMQKRCSAGQCIWPGTPWKTKAECCPIGRGCPHALWDIPEHALLSARTNQVLIGAWIQLLSQIWGRLQVGDAVLSLLSHTSRFGTICPLDAGVVTGPDVVLAWACFGPLSVLIGLSYLVRAVYVNKFPAWTPHYAASVITFFFCFFFAVRPTYMRGSEGGVPSRPLSSVLLSGEGAIAGRDCL